MTTFCQFVVVADTVDISISGNNISGFAIAEFGGKTKAMLQKISRNCNQAQQP